MADTLVTSGQVSAPDWAETLGAELRAAEAQGKPDTTATYFEAVVAALEKGEGAEQGVLQPHCPTRASFTEFRAEVFGRRKPSKILGVSKTRPSGCGSWNVPSQ